MFNQDTPDLPPQAAQHFLHLLDEVGAIQQLLLDETERLRARVRELEAGAAMRRAPSGPAPVGGQGRQP
jgi:hypothetical protein